jgi:hypothetical protein
LSEHLCGLDKSGPYIKRDFPVFHQKRRSIGLNTSGWLLLTIIFSILLMIVQRAERKRRVVTFIVMAFVASLVSSYGIYRISQCTYLKVICDLPIIRQNAQIIAWNTVNMAVLAAVVFNLLFWFLIGRYNPPGTSDDIIVFGKND